MAQSLSNLPIGAKVKFGKYQVANETPQDIIWLVVAKNHNSTPAYSSSNVITLLTEKIIDFRAYDGMEPSNSDSNRSAWGNNHYGHSNVHRWLNSNAGAGTWYTPAHSTDAPPNGSNTTRNVQYEDRPGFLYNFSQSEQNAIVSSTIRSIRPVLDGGSYQDLTAKIFLPSLTEVSGTTHENIYEGAKWAYFEGRTLKALLTQQVVSNSPTHETINTSQGFPWWLRTPYPTTNYMAYNVDEDGRTGGSATVKMGEFGIRPALNVLSNLSISDTTDSSGCYTFIWNSAPPAPTTLNVPTVYGGKSTTISWGKVTDPDGNTVTYQLEQSVNGGSFSTIYNGSNLSHSVVIPYGTTSVQFRVKATDTAGASSGYKTSSNITVINNNAPVISGSDGGLGAKTAPFSQTYTVTDANSNAVTITESIDGVRVRSYTATLGATNTFSVTGNTWLTLANGIHTMTITATDGIDSSVRTYNFTKAVTSFSVQRATAIESSARASRIKVSVVKTIPPEATFKVEVCNNGFDSSPTWEDATSVVLSELVYEFKNTTKTATKWGVNIRVTVSRNNGTGACYITSIGGNWE